MEDNLVILVCSCDSYSDLWEPFFKLLKKYWEDCPYKIVLNTESKVFQYEGLDITCYSLFPGKQVPYGERMLAHLDRIEAPYVLMMMDDFFIRRNVNEKKIMQVIQWMNENPKAATFSFQWVEDELNRPSEQYPGFSRRPQYGEYKLNFQAAIWRTDLLKKMWKKHETPWEWETVANFRTFNNQYEFYVLDTNQETPLDYGFRNSGMGVFRGKWVIDTVEQLFCDNDISIDYTVRGIYSPEDKNIVRMKKSSKISDEIRCIRSIGVIQYGAILGWRMLQKCKKRFGMHYYTDFVQYNREKGKVKVK